MTSSAGSRRGRFLERLWDIVASWGGPEAVKLPSKAQPGRELRVMLARDGSRVHVGSLSKQGDEYVFELLEG